jgi:DNA-directed RNA polymerase subunit RPC12/RpoP
MDSMNENVKKNSRKSYEVINLGFNSHDCCSELECPECHSHFNSYQITIGKVRCPNCNVRLHGKGTN